MTTLAATILKSRSFQISDEFPDLRRHPYIVP